MLKATSMYRRYMRQTLLARSIVKALTHEDMVMRKIRRWNVLLLGLIVASLLSACHTNVRHAAPDEHPSVPVEEAREDVRAAARNTLDLLYRKQPGARNAVEGAAGYAVFSNFGMKLMLAGSGTGRGVAVNNKTKEEVFMRMAEVQAGLGFGVKKFRLVWVLETQSAFDSFVRKGYQVGGQASLTAKASGVGGGLAGAASVSPGVWVYQVTDDGVAAELTVKGTRYYRDKGLSKDFTE